MSIYQKLILIALAPAVLIWVVGMYASQISENGLRTAIERRSMAQARGIMGEIDYVVHTRSAEWMAYSRSKLVQETILASNDELARMPDPESYIEASDQDWRSQGELLSPLMQSLMKSPLSEELRARLEKLNTVSDFTVYGEVFITNRFGSNVAQTNRTSDFRQNDEPWWQAAVRDGIYVGKIGLDESSGFYSTDICLRVDDEHGNLIGVLKAVLNIQEAINIVHRHAAEAENECRCRMSLVDSTGTLVYSSVDQARNFATAPGPHFRIPDSDDEQIIEKTEPRTGERMLSAFARSNGHAGFAGLGWGLVVEFAADEVLQPIQRLRMNILFIASMAALFSLLLGGVLAFSMSRRIRELTLATQALRDGSLQTVVAVDGRDELTALAESFNHMARELGEANDKLMLQTSTLEIKNQRLEHEIEQRQQAEKEREELNQKLVEASRQNGMAEVATGVLHNVGNVLNSVNVSANLLMEQIGGNSISRLCEASDVIAIHIDDLGEFLTKDRRGKRFPDLLDALSKNLAAARDSQLEELQGLVHNVQHIKAIVRSQQSLARLCGETEPVDLAQLVEEALKINVPGMSRHRIEIVREFEAMPPVVTERHKLLQIMINLISNAKSAVCETDAKDRQLILTIQSNDFEASIGVRDNGIGIVQDNLTRIFHHGFSTKPDGHGFGLHSSALAVQSVGGTLAARSEGPGCGSTFTVTLPLDIKTPCTT